MLGASNDEDTNAQGHIEDTDGMGDHSSVQQQGMGILADQSLYCHTRSQLGIQLIWILQVLTCKLSPEGLVYVRVHRPPARPAGRPAGRPPTRCYIGFSYFLTSNQKTSFTKSF